MLPKKKSAVPIPKIGFVLLKDNNSIIDIDIEIIINGIISEIGK